MSAATTADAAAAPPKGKKKLIIIIVAALLVLVIGGVGAVLLLKKGTPANDDELAEGGEAAALVSTRDPKATPVFTPLDPFTVNLADREADRYAQVGITLEMADQSSADALKTLMPAVRNNVLMVLAHKTSEELLARDGKETLAREVKLETARGMGYPVAAADEADAAEDDAGSASSKRKRRKPVEPDLPILAVYFSTFIIQ